MTLGVGQEIDRMPVATCSSGRVHTRTHQKHKDGYMKISTTTQESNLEIAKFQARTSYDTEIPS